MMYNKNNKEGEIFLEYYAFLISETANMYEKGKYMYR